jgi:cation transport regulator
MPYKKKSELPEQIKNNLPDHGQAIWKEAYNSAYDEYGGNKDEKEERSAKVAWAAVKHVYKKNESGDWVEKRD